MPDRPTPRHRTRTGCLELLAAGPAPDAHPDTWLYEQAIYHMRIAIFDLRELANNAPEPAIQARAARFSSFLHGRHEWVAPDEIKVTLGSVIESIN